MCNLHKHVILKSQWKRGLSCAELSGQLSGVIEHPKANKPIATESSQRTGICARERKISRQRTNLVFCVFRVIRESQRSGEILPVHGFCFLPLFKLGLSADMCSIGEDDFGDDGGIHSMVKDICPEETISGICKKCNKEESVIKLHFKEAECKNCFLGHVRHKFRATLGSSKILPKNAEVLVIFDGSAESLVLLDLLHFAVTQNTFKRLRCHPVVLYIDHSFLTNLSDKELPLIRKVLSRYSIKSFYISLSLNENPKLLDDVKNGDMFKEEQLFLQQVDKIKTATTRQDFLTKVRYNKIKLAAEHLGCKYVFLPDICPTLATNLLNNVILGRGGSTALDVSLLDDRMPNLKLIRPIKDLSAQEVQKYIEVNNLESPRNYAFEDFCGPSLQNLTKQFVGNLQKTFPATVSTIFRTGEKLAPNDSNNPKLAMNVNAANILETGLQQCYFCYANLDYFKATTLFATEFSRLVSHNASGSLIDLENLERNAKIQLEARQSPILRKLCHGCRNIYHDYPEYFVNQK